MGEEISASEFTRQDFQHFSERLDENLQALQKLLQQPDFGVGPGSIGSELEMYIVDSHGHPLGINTELLAAADDPQLTLELNRYNIEYNLTPYPLTEQPLLQTEREMSEQLANLDALAAGLGGRVVPVGILPTLHKKDFGLQSMTDRQRYHALVKALIRRRGRQFDIRIKGLDQIHLAMADITLEGANTSFQLHQRVDPAQFVDTYNAMQLATPLALAAGANSPTLFGQRLWAETRIPLFKQSIDTRIRDDNPGREPARVNFGRDWFNGTALELFEDTVRLYPPLLPICDDERALQALADGNCPNLHELRLHLSTVWWWNRPVFDPVGGGHLRIEMRALPAGPTAIDTVASAALLLGIAEYIRPRIGEFTDTLAFRHAEHNFYRAAQHGLDAKLIWLAQDSGHTTIRRADELLRDLLPAADTGLRRLGISAEESTRYLGVIDKRLARLSNGATWQLNQLAAYATNNSRDGALQQMLQRYIEHAHSNTPVAEWPIDD